MVSQLTWRRYAWRFAVEKLCDVAPLAEPKTATLLLESKSIPALTHSCGQLVVSVAGNGALYLNSELAGTVDDPGALSEMLRTIIECREEPRFYVCAESVRWLEPDISRPVPEYRQTLKTVYIKASACGELWQGSGSD